MTYLPKNELGSASQVIVKIIFDFFKKNLDFIPSKSELDDLWFLVEYRINYETIQSQQKTNRLKKLYCFLTDITNRMSINNPLSTLYLGVVEQKLGKTKESKNNFEL